MGQELNCEWKVVSAGCATTSAEMLSKVTL